MKIHHPFALAAITAAAASIVPAAHATEGGGATYPGGAENFLSAAAPPPGFYALEYFTHYQSDKLKDNNGNTVPLPVFKLRADVAVTRLVWSTPTPLWGGNLLYSAIIPVLLHQSIEVPGVSKSSSGLGDVTLAVALAHHYSPQLHSVAAIEVVTPTGSYDRNRAINNGRNYWAFQPLYTMSYIDPTGLNADFKAVLDFNRKNPDTSYKTGNELTVDYAVGWGVGKGFVVGASGHFYRQYTDDKVNGVKVVGHRAAATSIGPSLKFDNGNHWFITVKWQKEFDVRNRPQGSALWIKTILPI